MFPFSREIGRFKSTLNNLFANCLPAEPTQARAAADAAKLELVRAAREKPGLVDNSENCVGLARAGVAPDLPVAERCVRRRKHPLRHANTPRADRVSFAGRVREPHEQLSEPEFRAEAATNRQQDGPSAGLDAVLQSGARALQRQRSGGAEEDDRRVNVADLGRAGRGVAAGVVSAEFGTEDLGDEAPAVYVVGAEQHRHAGVRADPEGGGGALLRDVPGHAAAVRRDLRLEPVPVRPPDADVRPAAQPVRAGPLEPAPGARQL